MASTIPDPHPAADDASGTVRPAAERAGRIEAHGIDHITEAERHGRPRDLFSVWAAANVNYLSLGTRRTGPPTLRKPYLPSTLALTAPFAVVAFAVVAHADFAHQPAEPLTGVGLWRGLIAGTTIIASGPLSYTTSADFSRYL